MNVNAVKKKIIYGLPVLIGLCFSFYYLLKATDNVAYSDYIRLINAYLPDVGNPSKFFVPDVLTRVPITYLGRIINVKWFGYNTEFDLMLGLISFTLGAAVIAAYACSLRRRKAQASWYAWYLAVLVLYFGLNKWEMLTNGTGWVCFLSVSGFYYHYLVLDRAVRNGHQSRRDRILLIVLPSALTLLTAGPYCGSYSAILILCYLVMLADSYRKEHRINRLFSGYLAAVLIPLFLYLWSDAYAVYVHRGAVAGGSLTGTFLTNPLFFLKFILRALASAALGVDQLQKLNAAGGMFSKLRAEYLLGAFVLALYLFALYLTVRRRLWKETVLPLILILNGGLNHVLIVLSRWIFLNTEYGMSSRYELQYQVGLIGILLTFALCFKKRERQTAGAAGKRPVLLRASQTVICLGTAVLLAGSLYTTAEEVKTAPYRKEYLQTTRSLGLSYKTASDAELEEYLQHDPVEIRKAMSILEENNLNIFRNPVK